jgi:8-oxo-dGTP pyrophosphatase MutT (NUDIX family)
VEKIHNIQMLILRELLFNPNARFTDLNIKGLTSDHFSYHINSLLDSGYVVKDQKGSYSLSKNGKEFANTMDTEQLIVEKQPKVAVCIIAMKVVDEKKMLAIQRRLKEPYYGCQGFITGKVRFGEKLEEAASRELIEEMNLEGTLDYRGIFHEHCYSAEGDLLEDKIFNIFVADNCTGKLNKRFDSGENYWIPKEDFKNLGNKFYSEDDLYAFALSDQAKRSFYVQNDYITEQF